MTDPALAELIDRRLQVVRSSIERAAGRAGRPPASVRLVAVSKTFGPEHVRAAAAAGQLEFGENRVQEALQKIEALSDTGCSWHLIGHLQSNKARKAVGPFALVQSVDSVELLDRLDRAAQDDGRPLDVLLQVDLAGEATKFGAPPDEIERMLEVAVATAAVRVVGLMLLPPWFDDPERTRPYFRRLRAFRDDLLGRGVPAGMLRELSMGMSHDFEVAIEEGATIVRVGSAIFGARG